jgi:predicted transcriptional regulator
MLFMKEKQVAALIVLKDQNASWHLSKIARQSGTTYVYVTKLMSILEKKGLVALETKGKKRLVKLTEKGLKLANLLDEAKAQL